MSSHVQASGVIVSAVMKAALPGSSRPGAWWWRGACLQLGTQQVLGHVVLLGRVHGRPRPLQVGCNDATTASPLSCRAQAASAWLKHPTRPPDAGSLQGQTIVEGQFCSGLLAATMVLAVYSCLYSCHHNASLLSLQGRHFPALALVCRQRLTPDADRLHGGQTHSCHQAGSGSPGCRTRVAGHCL